MSTNDNNCDWRSLMEITIILLIIVILISTCLLYSRFIATSGLKVKEYKVVNDKIRDELSNPAITIGGYPDFTQSDPRYGRLSGKEECLFKLDSWTNGNLFNIGDCGILFTLISLEDLKNNNFENAVVDWDCY